MGKGRKNAKKSAAGIQNSAIEVGAGLLVQPATEFGLTVGGHLVAELTAGRWTDFYCAVAFAKLSGVDHLDGAIREFAAAGGRVHLLVGTDLDGTSAEAVSQLMGAVGDAGEVKVVAGAAATRSTFHPKMYLFTREEEEKVRDGLIISGSNNLTAGGLFSNLELALCWLPDRSIAGQMAVIHEARALATSWMDESNGLAVEMDTDRLRELVSKGILPLEKHIVVKSKLTASARPPSTAKDMPRWFVRKAKLPAAPAPPTKGSPAVSASDLRKLAPNLIVGPTAKSVPGAAQNAPSSFYLDMPGGKRKTELYLVKAALNENPAFFGHPFSGQTVPKNPKNPSQPERSPSPVVDVVVVDSSGTEIERVSDYAMKMWQYVNGKSANQDVRIYVPAHIQKLLQGEAIMEMKAAGLRPGIDYELRFLLKGSTDWFTARSIAVQPVPHSKRKYGWA